MAVFASRGKFDLELQLVPTLKNGLLFAYCLRIFGKGSFFLNFDSYNDTNSLSLPRVDLDEKVCH